MSRGKDGCTGCRFRSKGGFCNHHCITGVSRLKLGAIRYPGGGCARYQKKPGARARKGRQSQA